MVRARGLPVKAPQGASGRPAIPGCPCSLVHWRMHTLQVHWGRGERRSACMVPAVLAPAPLKPAAAGGCSTRCLCFPHLTKQHQVCCPNRRAVKSLCRQSLSDLCGERLAGPCRSLIRCYNVEGEQWVRLAHRTHCAADRSAGVPPGLPAPCAHIRLIECGRDVGQLCAAAPQSTASAPPAGATRRHAADSRGAATVALGCEAATAAVLTPHYLCNDS